MDEIINMITDDLSFEELSEITRTALSKIYSKLRSEGLYNPLAIVRSLGTDEWDVEMIFIDGGSHNIGEYYGQMFYL